MSSSGKAFDDVREAPAKGNGFLPRIRRIVRLLELGAFAVLVISVGYGFHVELSDVVYAMSSSISTQVQQRLNPLGSKPSSGLPLDLATISGTDGEGVAMRDSCFDDTRSPGSGIPDGAQVRILQSGGANCDGWRCVEWEQKRSWVRDSYLTLTPH